MTTLLPIAALALGATHYDAATFPPLLRSPNAPNSTLILGGTVYDGTGRPGRRADVRIVGDRIAAVAQGLRPRIGERVLSAKGLVVSPGFLDAHSHADANVAEHPLLESQVLQGITTAVVGQDGGGETPLTSLFAKLERARPTINFAVLAGHGAIRRRVMGEDYKRAPTDRELLTMRALLEEDMKAGALGLSSGLEYDPGFYATTEELISLAKVAAAYGGAYVSHVRDEGDGAPRSFRELIRIAREARIKAHISHIKLATVAVWGRATEVARLVDAARKQGLRISADVYPYLFWQSTITVLTLDRNWDDPKVWERALASVGGPHNVRLTSYSPDPSWVGKTIGELALIKGSSPASVIQEIVRKTHGPDGKGEEAIACTAMTERDLRTWLRKQWVMFGSDGRHLGTHPRGAGTFPRVLGRYVRDEKVLSLAEAIHKMTLLPASVFNIQNRGRIAPGWAADIVVFDPRKIQDLATPESPTRLAIGVRTVLVNGVPVLLDGRITGARPGRVLRSSGYVKPDGRYTFNTGSLSCATTSPSQRMSSR